MTDMTVTVKMTNLVAMVTLNVAAQTTMPVWLQGARRNLQEPLTLTSGILCVRCLVCTCPRNLRPSPGPPEACNMQREAESLKLLQGEKAKDVTEKC